MCMFSSHSSSRASSLNVKLTHYDTKVGEKVLNSNVKNIYIYVYTYKRRIMLFLAKLYAADRVRWQVVKASVPAIVLNHVG